LQLLDIFNTKFLSNGPIRDLSGVNDPYNTIVYPKILIVARP